MRLALGARRVGTLEPRATAYFEGKDDDNQQLTPTWMLDRMTEWGDRSVRDFGRYLVRVLVERSQRIALKKTRYRSDGVVSIPSRVYVRDEFIFRDSNEGGGGVALRWDQLTTVLGGLGYVQRNADDLWEVTDRGRSVQ
ncbi:hypothetical protein KMZ30_21350 [Phycicoccus sp. KQZ13P-1]|nr:hypothetical protein [Phycicoccus mangrovi]